MYVFVYIFLSLHFDISKHASFTSIYYDDNDDMQFEYILYCLARRSLRCVVSACLVNFRILHALARHKHTYEKWRHEHNVAEHCKLKIHERHPAEAAHHMHVWTGLKSFTVHHSSCCAYSLMFALMHAMLTSYAILVVDLG